MAFITLDKEKLKKNYTALENVFSPRSIKWAVVSKLLCGEKIFLEQLLDLGIRNFCDSRVSNLKTIKSLNPDTETIYIKPPPKRSIPAVVKYADISFNTEIDTIEMLSEEAKKQDTLHKIIIMIELGELREGVMRDDLLEFYERIFKLPNIKVVGIGTNLTCMYGVLPSHDKLIQLSLYKQLIEARFDRKIDFVSGGSSVSIPLIFEGLLPAGVNHFRVGETLYLGTDVYHNRTFKTMEHDVFQLFAEIIELIEKPKVPLGEFGENLLGETKKFDDAYSETSYRAIIDLGLLDIDENHIKIKNKELKIVGASSDMLVIDLGKNEQNYQVGDLLEFEMDYFGMLRIMNSKYIEKRVK
ncbi:MAG: alanine/ornithine racemase family PLP-dependent enzyme [Cytophagales bacterium]